MQGKAAADPVYDPVARGIHWVNAMLAAVVVLLAWGISGAQRHGSARESLIVLHGSLGIVILLLMLFWAGWRIRHPAPSLRPVLSRIEMMLARATQTTLHAAFVLMSLTGYVSLAAAGQRVSFFGLVEIPALVPESGLLSQVAIALHLIGEFVIYGLLAGHIGAALIHGFVRRDGILERMLPRSGG
ncbi:MAG TPA: cytochrome b [Stellaceae bacterium]|nr:cytochrome b [Stellaceae bacterium]